MDNYHLTQAEELQQNDEDDAQVKDMDDMEEFIKQERERDERERMWAEAAHKLMHEEANDE